MCVQVHASVCKCAHVVLAFVGTNTFWHRYVQACVCMYMYLCYLENSPDIHASRPTALGSALPLIPVSVLWLRSDLLDVSDVAPVVLETIRP
jgi:hypothetical protein